MDANLTVKSDDELIVLFQNGTQEAFEEIVLRYKNSVYQYILSLVKDDGAAGDLFQDVFLALFKHAADFRAEGKLKSWLFQTARNKVLHFWRDNKTPLSLDETDEEGNAFWHETLADDAPALLDVLETQELGAQIRQAAEKLPPRQREVVFLRQYMSFKEMADFLHRPLGTVLADCHRGLQKMKVLLNQGDFL